MAPNDERSESLSPLGEGSKPESSYSGNSNNSLEGLAPAREIFFRAEAKDGWVEIHFTFDGNRVGMRKVGMPYDWMAPVLADIINRAPALPQGEVEAVLRDLQDVAMRTMEAGGVESLMSASYVNMRVQQALPMLASPRSTVQGPKPEEVDRESEDIRAAKVVILDLCSALERHMDKRKFHPMGEDDRAYHAACAWLAGEAPAPAVQGARFLPTTEEGNRVVDGLLRDHYAKERRAVQGAPTEAGPT